MLKEVRYKKKIMINMSKYTEKLYMNTGFAFLFRKNSKECMFEDII